MQKLLQEFFLYKTDFANTVKYCNVKTHVKICILFHRNKVMTESINETLRVEVKRAGSGASNSFCTSSPQSLFEINSVFRALSQI